MFNFGKKSGTQKNLWDYISIEDGLILMKNGEYRLALEVYPLNFELLDDNEKLIKVQNFENIIRTQEYGFPIKILMQTRKTSAEDYAQNLIKHFNIKGEKKDQFEVYQSFLREQAKRGEQISKRFFVIISTKKDYAKETLNDIYHRLYRQAETIKGLLEKSDINASLLKTKDVIEVMMLNIDEDRYIKNKAFFEGLDTDNDINNIEVDTKEQIRS
ncbi:MAG: hypothetical protein KC414_13340, partial [Romboutsia sp.]|nr:hypothetical protein [Romboutsia sp.]